ncbi:cytochrome p450 cyp736a12 [Phtheirospermum japonicum]|uniref:Cytochrome p450 cyp736a12 n=1 Tax=Phtheirospermum japonicum TaxID=374723 RepID=A0A830CID2_9LAMI|nr:cytochrome p450 cyp736a12 [Phtheirospermum japonicum]
MALIWTAILSVIILVYLLQKLLGPEKKKMFPPGPWSLPIVGHFHLLGRNPHQDLHRLARKYGPIMGLRFGFMPTIIVSSAAGAELFLKTHDLNFASRPESEAAKHVSYGQRNLVSAPYSPYWRDMRKLCTLELLSNRRINQFQAMRRAELELLVSSLKRAAEKSEIVDFSSRISGLSGDMNCLMIFGKKYADGDLDVKGFKAVMVEAMEIGASFNLADYFPYIGVLDLHGMNRRMKELSRIFDGFLEKVIDEHVQNKKAGENDGTEDFVDTMMSIMESGEAGFEFDRRNVKAVLLVSRLITCFNFCLHFFLNVY